MARGAETGPRAATLYTISIELPRAMARWYQVEAVAHQGLSSLGDEAFGRDYGVLLKK